MSIAAVVLAAGASSRLGEPKQLLRDANGEALVHKVAREALECGAAPVIVVIGAAGTEVNAAVRDLNVVVVENAHWAEGLSSSIRAGVAAAGRSSGEHAEQMPPASADELVNNQPGGLLLLTCDMPSVGVPHLLALLRAFQNGATRVASEYGNTRGIPAIVSRAEFGELLALKGDKGAKALLMSSNTVVVPLEHGTFDLDTPQDVARWRTEAQARPT